MSEKVEWFDLNDAPKDGTYVRLRISAMTTILDDHPGRFHFKTVKARWSPGKSVDPNAQWWSPHWTSVDGSCFYDLPENWRPMTSA
jgi:hypothetical protein